MHGIILESRCALARSSAGDRLLVAPCKRGEWRKRHAETQERALGVSRSLQLLICILARIPSLLRTNESCYTPSFSVIACAHRQI